VQPAWILFTHGDKIHDRAALKRYVSHHTRHAYAAKSITYER